MRRPYGKGKWKQAWHIDFLKIIYLGQSTCLVHLCHREPPDDDDDDDDTVHSQSQSHPQELEGGILKTIDKHTTVDLIRVVSRRSCSRRLRQLPRYSGSVGDILSNDYDIKQRHVCTEY